MMFRFLAVAVAGMVRMEALFDGTEQIDTVERREEGEPLWTSWAADPKAWQNWAPVQKPFVGVGYGGRGGLPANATHVNLPEEILTIELTCADQGLAEGLEGAQHQSAIDLHTWWQAHQTGWGQGAQPHARAFRAGRTLVIYEKAYSVRSDVFGVKRPNPNRFGATMRYTVWKSTVENCAELEVKVFQSQKETFGALQSQRLTLLGSGLARDVRVPVEDGAQHVAFPITQRCEVTRQGSLPTKGPAHCAAGKPGLVVLSGQYEEAGRGDLRDKWQDFMVGRVVLYLDQ